MTDQPDYKDTVFLPKTDFPMKAGLAQKEPTIAARWAAEDLHGRLRAARAGRERFILHDGPPYANGDIHMGHALNKVLKDIIVRSQSLLGKDAPYVPGWDCHGLPIEWKIEEAYRKKKLNKDEVPASEFRAECRAYADKWVDVQKAQFKRLGIMGDWDNPYLTMNYEAEAAIVGELLKFAETGQLYRGAKPVMWSPVEKTALAEAEVEYEDVTSTQIDVAFEIVEAPNAPELVGAYAVVWTTTPWTIPTNQAIAYGEGIEYWAFKGWQVELITTTERGDPDTPSNRWEGTVLVAKDQIGEFLERCRFVPDGDKPFWTGTGRDLAGAVARHPLANLLGHSREGGNPGSQASASLALDPRFRGGDGGEGGGGGSGHPIASLLVTPGSTRGPASSSEAEGSGAPDHVRGDDGAVRREGEGASTLHPGSHLAEFFLRPRPFIPAPHVTTDAGTGLVHMAPDHGEEDFFACKEVGIDPVFAVEGDGRYRADWAWLGGQGSVINPKFNAPDGPICTDLRNAGALLSAGEFRHSYPHSWRSKARIIYRCTPQWFIPMDRRANSDRPGDGRSPEMGAQAPRTDISTSAAHPHPALSLKGEGSVAAPDGQVAPGLPLAGAAVALAVQTPETNGATLRGVALDAIENTRWVPHRAKNRIRSMVEGRPDWVISRQRAWGVPIALYVHRQTGQYLNDPAVNARIVEAFRHGGADAWFGADHQALLGPDYALADYEVINDILDVWFDSGSTHSFVVEQRYGEGVRADLYLEGSDQHRGWFQSSLLESCGTRGRAPYEAVLTHGFALDGQGRKMSKSLGNTVDPLKVMDESGADILRMWAASTDYFDDVRIGKEVLAGASDAYRKLRNTFRYLLGALADFDESERVPVAEMPELERYMLHLLATLDGELREVVDDRGSERWLEFGHYTRALNDFANIDLSALFFDIRKDCLYCDVNVATGAQTAKRRAYRTVLDTLFHALIRYAAPIIPFTGEEVWKARYPDADSVHLLEWPEIDSGWQDAALGERWAGIREARETVNEAIEPLRREKIVRSSLAAEVRMYVVPQDVDFAEICIVADVTEGGDGIVVTPTAHHKCGRCWRHLPDVVEDGALCGRCDDVLKDKVG